MRDVLATFRALKINREAVAVLLLLRHACEQERVTADLLEQVAGFLKRLERDPSVRFEYAPVV